MWFNPMITWLLKSPLHGMVSRNVMLVSVTGRKSGRTISTPTNYLRDGNTLWIISWRDRNWWKNLRACPEAQVLLAGRSAKAFAQVIEDEKAVSQNLFDYYVKSPQAAKYVQIGLDAAGQPVRSDCDRAAQSMVMVKINLT